MSVSPVIDIAREGAYGATPPPIALPNLLVAGFIKINVFAVGSLPIKVAALPVKMLELLYTFGKNCRL